MFVLSVSLGALFRRISGSATSGIQKKAIEIGGIGSMVYAFLVVTPMHNLMIDIALPFALTAVLAILQLLYAGRRSLLFVSGTVCLVLNVLTATMYYEKLLWVDASSHRTEQGSRASAMRV